MTSTVTRLVDELKANQESFNADNDSSPQLAPGLLSTRTFKSFLNKFMSQVFVDQHELHGRGFGHFPFVTTTGIEHFNKIYGGIADKSFGPEVTHISAPHRDGASYRLIEGATDADSFLLVSFRHTVSRKKEDREEEVTEWVLLNENTKERRTVMEKGKPKIRKIKGPVVDAIEAIEYRIPIKVLADILDETGRDSFFGAPSSNYVPPPLGEGVMRMFGGDLTVKMLPNYVKRAMMAGRWPNAPVGEHFGERDIEFWQNIGGGERDIEFWQNTGGAYEMKHGGSKPFRVFLQPDDKGRFEVVVEPYSNEEIMANAVMRNRRQAWASWERLDEVPAVKEFIASVYQPKIESK